MDRKILFTWGPSISKVYFPLGTRPRASLTKNFLSAACQSRKWGVLWLPFIASQSFSIFSFVLSLIRGGMGRGAGPGGKPNFGPGDCTFSVLFFFNFFVYLFIYLLILLLLLSLACYHFYLFLLYFCFMFILFYFYYYYYDYYYYYYLLLLLFLLLLLLS
jgi:hypothetical protein